MDAEKKPTDFWQDHSLAFLEMAFRTDRRERIAKPDGYGKKTGDCGDTVEIFLVRDGDTIATMAYDINGCLNTNACCNALVALVEHQNLAAGWEVTPEKVAGLLETLPPDHFHCAELVVGTLYLALANLRENQRFPWKKSYS
jgi:nitrogen fixation NifU-like protein